MNSQTEKWKNNMDIRRGDIFLVNLEPVKGSEQGRTRPCLVIQNDIGNRFSPTVIVAPLTTKAFSKEYPTNVAVGGEDSGLDSDSTVLLNQIRTIDKSRLIRRLCRLDTTMMQRVDMAIKVSLGLE